MIKLRKATYPDLLVLTAILGRQARRYRAQDRRLPTRVQNVPFQSRETSPEAVLTAKFHATFVAELNGNIVGGVNMCKVVLGEKAMLASYHPHVFTSIGILAIKADSQKAIYALIEGSRTQAKRWGALPLLSFIPCVDKQKTGIFHELGFRDFLIYALYDNKRKRDTTIIRGSTSEIVVRPATIRDLDRAVQIGMSSLHYHASLEPTIFIAPSEPHKMCQRMERALNVPDVSTVLVAEKFGNTVGFCRIYKNLYEDTANPPLFLPGFYGLIAEVAVDEKYRRQGIGRRLFLAADNWFRQHNIRLYRLNYFPHNPAASGIWSSLGFKPLWKVLLLN